MPDYDNTNRGVLFRNDKKETPKHPDYTGSINVKGHDFYLSGWINTAKSGVKYFSLSVRPKEPERQDAAPQRGVPQEEMDDDIPF